MVRLLVGEINLAKQWRLFVGRSMDIHWDDTAQDTDVAIERRILEDYKHAKGERFNEALDHIAAALYDHLKTPQVTQGVLLGVIGKHAIVRKGIDSRWGHIDGEIVPLSCVTKTVVH